jgi:DNA-binding NarL/FixJ family response regulator
VLTVTQCITRPGVIVAARLGSREENMVDDFRDGGAAAHLGERHRIARELHDRVGNWLSVAHRQLELLQGHGGVATVPAADRVEKAHRAVAESMESLRAVICDLRREMPRPSSDVTIAIVDDHAILREGLREILEAQDDMVVAGEARDGAGAIALVAEKRPDVVLLGVEIPGDDATATVRRIRALSPSSKVIVLSGYDGPRPLRDLLAAGVRGYLRKSVHGRELVTAIRGAHGDPGRVVLDVAPDSLARAQDPAADPLSAREREVLELTAQALSNAQIAARLGRTEATVKRHLRNIFSKLGAVSRIDAVNKAAAAALITVEDRRPRRTT